MADINFKCPACGKDLVVDSAGVGIQVDCPNCSARLTVPSATSPPKEAAKPRACPACGTSLAPDAVVCTKCGYDSLLDKQLVVTIGTPTESTSTVNKVDQYTQTDDLPVVCPSCGAKLHPGFVICTNCGLNFKTGARVHFSTPNRNVNASNKAVVSRATENDSALVPCLECGKPLSRSASKCPNCGAGRITALGVTPEMRLGGLLVVLLGGAVMIFRAFNREPQFDLFGLCLSAFVGFGSYLLWGGRSKTVTPHICPSCAAVLAPDAVVCIQCGYDFLIGKRLIVATSPSHQEQNDAPIVQKPSKHGQTDASLAPTGSDNDDSDPESSRWESTPNQWLVVMCLGALLAMPLLYWLLNGHTESTSDRKSDPSNHEASQKPLAADGFDDKSIERRRIECEQLKPLLDQFAYLEAGFAQGISQNDFIEAQRRIEAEYIKLGAGSRPSKTEWASDSQVPEKLRTTIQGVRPMLDIIRMDWRAKTEGAFPFEDPSAWMENAANQMKRAREETARYIQNGG